MTFVLLVLQILLALSLGYGVLQGYRWIYRQSRVLGLIVAAAILVRGFAGAALFWISYLGLPIASSLQLGGGFWRLAPDARSYFHYASDVLESGVPTNHFEAPSPFFVNALATWMAAVGAAPAAGFFLNLCLYTVLVVLMVRVFEPVDDWRRDLPCVVGVTAYSFSPVLLLHSTQPLKDDMSGVLTGLACLGVIALSRWLASPDGQEEAPALAIGTSVLALATFGLAGIRPYYAFLVWCALAGALVTGALARRRPSLMRRAGACASVLAVVWLAFWAASGPHYATYAPSVERWSLTQQTGELAERARQSRTGFIVSGGATNVLVPLREDVGDVPLQRAPPRRRSTDRFRANPIPETDAAPKQARLSRVEAIDARQAIPLTVGEQARAVAVGLAVVFVPMSLLQAITSIQFAGGRGLLWVTDLDTIFLNLGCLAVLVLLWRRRRLLRPQAPAVVFVGLLSVVTAVLLGYVVTNFGTLWRLRVLVTIPIWMLAVGIPARSATPAAKSPDERTAARVVS